MISTMRYSQRYGRTATVAWVMAAVMGLLAWPWLRRREPYMPHQSKRECARRRRQLAKGWISNYRIAPLSGLSGGR